MIKKISFITLLTCVASSFALEGGPSQPDYAQFEPSGMTDMVSLQSGDFSYQIPLSDIPGPYGNYPLSLSYHAGISPQQEASWVGLGWSLNPGAINRDVRGVPDDQFHGGTLGFIYQYSATQVWSVDLGYSVGIFSVGQNFSSDGSVGFSATVGPKIAGVVGVGFTVGTDAVGIEASVGYANAKLNAGLMFSTKDGKPSAHVGASIGVAGASLGAQVSTGSGASARVGFGNSTAGVGMTVSSNGVSASAHVGEVAVSKSKNGASVSVGGGSVSVSNSASNGDNKASTAGFAIVVPTQIGVFSFGFSQTTYEYWMRSATSEYLYGYIYQAGPAIDVDSLNDLDGIPDAAAAARKSSGSIPWKWTMKGRTLESMGRDDMSPAYDMYSVSSEGASGTFRPFAREKHQLYKLVSNKFTTDRKSIETYSTILDNDTAGWPLSNEFRKDSLDGMVDRDTSTYKDYAYCMNSSTPCSIYGMYQTNFRNRGNRLVFNSDSTQFEERGGMRFLFVGEGSGYYESDDVGADLTRERSKISSKLLKKTVNGFEYALYGSKKVEPLFEDNSPIGKLAGFTVTTSDGSKYIFRQPVRSYLKVDYSINREKGVPVFVDKSSSKYDNFWVNLLKGIRNVNEWAFSHMEPITTFTDVYDFIFKKGEFEEKCNPENKKKSEDYFFSYTVNMNPHATQWLLSEVRGADYVKLGNKDIGYNVKFTYTAPSLYRWRTPYARPNIRASEAPNFRSPRNSFTPEGCDSRMYQASFGVKEYVYLKSIETSTHRVEFELNEDERVDGKGWKLDSTSIIPILVQTTLALEVDSNVTEKKHNETDSTYYWEHSMNVKPKYIYFNSPLPEKILTSLYDHKNVSIEGLEEGSRKEAPYGYWLSISSMGKGFEVDSGSFQRTRGKESTYGLYRLALKSTAKPLRIFYLNTLVKDSIKNAIDSTGIITLGENGNLTQNPYIDWSKFIFTNTTDVDSMENQMRYLTKIAYYRKGANSNSTYKYKEYNFNYDYSLQPKTLNSYCKGRYPSGDSVEYIVNSPDSVGVDICKVDTTSKFLYGKLTLRSISEKGCQNGKCATLPPFIFSYNSPSATSTRISSRDGWIDYFQEKNEESESAPNVLSDEYFNNFDNIDATILASSNTTDEYGFWANTANPENHKVDQSFADYGAAAWSLNKVVDPTGGNLEVEYERDRYGAGIDYSQDKRTIEFYNFNKCSDSDRLCIEIKPLYWREQCLGPRAAYWDTEKPDGYAASDYAYLDTMGIGRQSKVFFNLSLQVNAKIKCGIFGVGRCARHGSVAVVGDGTILDIQNRGDKKILVINRQWSDIIAAALKAGRKINDELNIIDSLSHSGYLWTGKSLNQVKAGDLRVTKLTRHDIGLKSLTTYEYDDGELAQLADSSYTTVLGNRFYSNKNTVAIPDVHLDPISRIVGFDDDDLMFVPGARISYPKVTVKNSSSDTSKYNGTTEFYYVTPETGVPEEYVDSATRAILKPFIKLNVLFVSMNAKDDFDNGRVLRFTLLDTNEQKVVGTDSIRIMAFPDERTSLFFYSDNILSAKYLKVDKMHKGGQYDSKTRLLLTPLTKFNELSLVVYGGNEMNSPLDKVEFIWKRSQKQGFYPILYKQVAYTSESINVAQASSDKRDEMLGYDSTSDPSHIHFERTVKYHDLTAFLGLNYKTIFKRGTGSNAIVVKKDSSFYSTMIPDIVGQDDSVKYKVGRQVEKWSSEQRLKCVNGVGGDDPNGSVDNTNYCRDQQMHLYMRNSTSYTNRKDFTYIRYPAFQIGSASYVGHDNQMNGSEPNKFGKTELRNHAYDPLTGSPTATLATVDIEDGKVLRKLTQMTPYYAISDTGVSSKMFLRNMLTQNYMEAVYTDTLQPSGNTAWNTVSSSNNNLRSFSISPYRFATLPVANNLSPIVAWGTYNSKEEPKNIIGNAMEYANNVDSLPSLVQYSGTEIVSINQNLKVTEIKDVLGRSMATLFSNDGMSQLSLFYPATQAEVGALLPYRDTVLCLGQCSGISLLDNISVNNGVIQTGSQYAHVSCGRIPDSVNVVLEYRIKENGKSWETHRDTVAPGSTPGLAIPPWSKLNYFRVYPEKAESKTFLYDKYGNLVQTVAEDNTSTFYEYDPLGNLVQSRNDDGVSFKAHHREYMNDSTTQKVKGE